MKKKDSDCVWLYKHSFRVHCLKHTTHPVIWADRLSYYFSGNRSQHKLSYNTCECDLEEMKIIWELFLHPGFILLGSLGIWGEDTIPSSPFRFPLLMFVKVFSWYNCGPHPWPFRNVVHQFASYVSSYDFRVLTVVFKISGPTWSSICWSGSVHQVVL